MPVVRRLLGGAEERQVSRRLPSVTAAGTAAGVSVTGERALQIGAVYSCVTLLAEAVAGLPVSMFDRRQDGTRVPIMSNPVLSLVKDQPNPVIDAAELWRTVMGWMLLRGNGYVYVQRNGSGQPIGLWPLSPNAVEPRRLKEGARAGQLVYQVSVDDEDWAPVSQRDGLVDQTGMLHFRAFGLGVEGLSPIGLARQSIGISFAAQQYMGGFYSRDASPGSHIEVPDELSDEAFTRLEAQWRSLHQGFNNAHRLAILEGGAKWASASLSPKDAEFIETQKFSRSEIASMYGVPPHMIGDTDKSTSWGTGIAEQGIGFVTYSLRRWTNRLERVTRRLLAEESTERFRWNVDGLMQGDLKARYEAYAQGRQWGWLSVNDIKAKEDEEPVDGGDVYLQPLNMVPAGTTPTPAGQRSTRSAPERRAVPEIASTSAMVALYPTAEVAQRLAIEDGLAPGDLHVTLAYLGQDLTEEQLADAEAVLAGIAVQFPALPGQVGGLGQFPEGDDGVPVYAPVDVALLSEVRQALVEALTAADVPVSTDHGFTPHMTLTYLQDGDAEPTPVPATPTTFAALSLVAGTDRTDYPFTGGTQ